MTSPKPFQATENPFQAINDPRNIYAVALLELQDLESKPVCHRTAAKLLVSDCQLLNGKSEATVHDSGRKARDFVDFYAAAMAICDLERGDFDIPRICDKFREGSLAEMATPERPTLHVSTKEIDGCLRGLARDTAAWSTWVSYRHKALAFCEAARTDYEKTEKIHLYQRLAEVLHGLTNEADASMRAFGVQIQEVEQRLSGLALAVDRLREDVQMADAATTSKQKEALGVATNMQQLLAILFKSALENQAEAAFSHNQALATMDERSKESLELLGTFMTGLAASSASLDAQLQESRLHAVELAHRQLVVEKSLLKMQDLSAELSARHVEHNELLSEATNRTHEIVDQLGRFASLSTVFSSVSFSFWPHIVFPVASLVAGSFGLSPSVFRNLGLMALGEIIGLGFTKLNFTSIGHMEHRVASNRTSS